MKFFLTYLCFFIILLNTNSNYIKAQNHDFNFIDKSVSTFSGAKISYSEDLEDVELDILQWEGSVFASPMLSDKDGNFLGYTDNRHIYDGINQIALNGDSIAVGYLQNFFLENYTNATTIGVGNNAAFIPITDSLFYYFHKSSELWIGSPEWAINIQEMGQDLTSYSDGLYLTEVNLTEAGRLQLPEEKKKQLLIDDLLEHRQLTFCKHANGNDWWLHVPQVLTDSAYVLRIYESGEIENHGLKYYSENNGRVRSSSGTVLSEDGTSLARLIVRSDTSFMHILEIFDFDRCTGDTERVYLGSFPLSDRFTSAGDIEFSENGRFLYIAIGSVVLQMDTEEGMNNSVDTVAVWDGYLHADFVATLFDNLWRLPNDKILVGSFAATPFLHYIHSPNEAGEMCEFEQRAMQFPLDPLNPPYGTICRSLPSYPPYRMSAAEVVCETSLTEVSTIKLAFEAYPNPIHDYVTVSNIGQSRLIIYDNHGHKIMSKKLQEETTKIVTQDFNRGIYYFTFYDEFGAISRVEKIVKL